MRAVTIYLDDAEFDRLDAVASLYGMTPADLLRHLFEMEETRVSLVDSDPFPSEDIPTSPDGPMAIKKNSTLPPK